jgi:hypothetical protein
LDEQPCSFQPRTAGSNGIEKIQHEASFVKQEFFSFDGWIDLDLIIYNFSFCLKFHPDTTSPYELIGELALFMVESIQKESKFVKENIGNYLL